MVGHDRRPEDEPRHRSSQPRLGRSLRKPVESAQGLPDVQAPVPSPTASRRLHLPARVRQRHLCRRRRPDVLASKRPVSLVFS